MKAIRRLLPVAATLMALPVARAQTPPHNAIARATCVTGRVVLQGSGKPVAHVTLSFFATGSRYGEFVALSDRQTTETDAKGRYTFAAVSGEKSFEIYLNQMGDRYAAIAESHGVTHSGKTVTQPDFVVTTGTFLQGTVRDANGAPLAEATVWVASSSTYTGKDGRYQLCVQPGTHLTANVTGRFAAQIISFNEPIQHTEIKKTFDARPGQTISLDFTCTNNTNWIAFHGTVADVNGKPLLGVRIGMSADTNLPKTASLGLQERTISDAKGHWTEDYLFRYGQYHVAVGAGWEIVPSTLPSTLTPDATLNVIVRRIPALTVQGRVVTTKGAPIANVKILANVLGGVSKRTDLAEVLTDKQGHYRIGPLEPGSVVSFVSLTRDGFWTTALCEPITDSASVGSDVTREASPMTMIALSRTVRGRVVDALGEPVANALVWSSESDTEHSATRTNHNGEFTLHGLPETTSNPAQATHITAAEGHRVGTVLLAPGADCAEADIALQMPSASRESDTACARRIAEDALINQCRPWTDDLEDGFLDLLTASDPDAALKQSGLNWEGQARVFSIAARDRAHDPTLEAWANNRLHNLPSSERSVMEAELGLTLATLQPAVAARFNQAAQKDAEPGLTQDDILDRVRRNALLVALGKVVVTTPNNLAISTADTLISDAAMDEFRGQFAPYSQERLLPRYVQFLGHSSSPAAPALIDAMTRGNNSGDRYRLFRAFTAYWATTDPALARIYWKYLTAAISAGPRQEIQFDLPEQDELATRIAVGFAPKDFTVALAVLQTLPVEKCALASARVAHAADIAGVYPAETARIWEDLRTHIATQHEVLPEEMLVLANLARHHSPELAAEFLQRGQEAFEKERTNLLMYRGMMRSPFYIAAYDPALARELAEAAFVNARDHSEIGRLYGEMARAARSMSAVDRDRALAMMEETVQLATKASPYNLANIRQEQRLLVARLLTPPSERDCMPQDAFEMHFGN